VEFRAGEVRTLIYIGTQFSCIRLDVAEFLRKEVEPYTFSSYSVTFFGNVTRGDLMEAITLRVKLM
jgi:hypothetical protein